MPPVKGRLKRFKQDQVEWLENNPDLNPVENLWEIVKNKVSEKKRTSITLQSAGRGY